MKGGSKWKEGADTCIFKPNVACKEDPKTYPQGLPHMISRLVETNGSDMQTEQILKLYFPDLVNRKVVVVHEKACTPSFTESNLSKDSGFKQRIPSPCSLITARSTNYTNLITPEYWKPVIDVMILKDKPNDFLFYLFRGAIYAAVNLVPDNGVWVIHMDLHLENIFVNENPLPFQQTPPYTDAFTALADWGKAIAFDSTLPIGIKEGLDDFFPLVQSSFYNKPKTFQDIAKNPAIKYLSQHTPTGFATLHTLLTFVDSLSEEQLEYKNKTTLDRDEMKFLRGYMVYIILKQLYGFLDFQAKEPDWLQKCLETNNQAQLIALLNENIQLENNIPFYDPNYLKAPGNATGAGAGSETRGGKRKQTRKHKRKLKQTRRI